MLKKGNCLMVAVPGELDHHTAEPIRRAVDKRLEEGVIRNVVFDFRNTMLMGRYRLLRYMGGTVTAIHVSDRILRIMQLSGIHKFIEISQETVWTQKRK